MGKGPLTIRCPVCTVMYTGTLAFRRHLRQCGMGNPVTSGAHGNGNGNGNGNGHGGNGNGHRTNGHRPARDIPDEVPGP